MYISWGLLKPDNSNRSTRVIPPHLTEAQASPQPSEIIWRRARKHGVAARTSRLFFCRRLTGLSASGRFFLQEWSRVTFGAVVVSGPSIWRACARLKKKQEIQNQAKESGILIWIIKNIDGGEYAAFQGDGFSICVKSIISISFYANVLGRQAEEIPAIRVNREFIRGEHP